MRWYVQGDMRCQNQQRYSGSNKTFNQKNTVAVCHRSEQNKNQPAGLTFRFLSSLAA